MVYSRTDFLERIADYVRLEIEIGKIKVDDPVAIAWRDYARFELKGATGGYYDAVLQKALDMFSEEKYE